MSKPVEKHEGTILVTHHGIDVINCATCGFTHITPLPDPAEQIRFYREKFYTTEKTDYLDNAKTDRDWLISTYNERFDIFESLLPARNYHLLDIGCGPGFFLSAGKERGWNVLGIEPSPQAAEFARSHGVQVIEGFFDATTAAAIGPQDVVHMSQVLEHIANPAELLRQAHTLLTSNGLICISVPNDFNPLQLALQKFNQLDPWWVVPDHHLNYFSFDTLEALLRREGFEPVQRDASFPLELFALMGDDYISNPELGSIIHSKRKQLEFTLDKTGFNNTKRALFSALAMAGLGRLAVVIARKIEP